MKPVGHVIPWHEVGKLTLLGRGKEYQAWALGGAGLELRRLRACCAGRSFYLGVAVFCAGRRYHGGSGLRLPGLRCNGRGAEERGRDDPAPQGTTRGLLDYSTKGGGGVVVGGGVTVPSSRRGRPRYGCTPYSMSFSWRVP